MPLIDVKKDRYVTKSAGGITMEVSKTVLECDFLINLPVLKGHCQTAMTCALKNMKGCISDRSKRQFHTQGLHRPIASLNRVRSADLIIVDSICGDLDFEEGNVETNRLFAARDSVLSDAFGASLIGFASEDIPYIHLAEELGVGSSDLSRMNLISLNEPIEQPLATPTGRAGSLSRHIEERSACSACYGTLIHALKRLDEVGRLKNLKHTISIGQGFKGVEDPKKVGVGSCTQSLGKSLPGCPPKAVDMAEFIKGWSSLRGIIAEHRGRIGEYPFEYRSRGFTALSPLLWSAMGISSIVQYILLGLLAAFTLFNLFIFTVGRAAQGGATRNQETWRPSSRRPWRW